MMVNRVNRVNRLNKDSTGTCRVQAVPGSLAGKTRSVCWTINRRRELFSAPGKVDLAVPPYQANVYRGLAHFGAVPAWPGRYGPGHEFRSMFMRSGTAVRP